MQNRQSMIVQNVCRWGMNVKGVCCSQQLTQVFVLSSIYISLLFLIKVLFLIASFTDLGQYKKKYLFITYKKRKNILCKFHCQSYRLHYCLFFSVLGLSACTGERRHSFVCQRDTACQSCFGVVLFSAVCTRLDSTTSSQSWTVSLRYMKYTPRSKILWAQIFANRYSLTSSEVTDVRPRAVSVCRLPVLNMAHTMTRTKDSRSNDLEHMEADERSICFGNFYSTKKIYVVVTDLRCSKKTVLNDLTELPQTLCRFSVSFYGLLHVTETREGQLTMM